MDTSNLSLLLAGAVGAVCLVGCSSLPPSTPTTRLDQTTWGTLDDGTPIALYTLRNRWGCEAKICNYGGIIVSLKVPDKNGQLGDVVLGYDNLSGYVTNNPFFGCLVGRYGNRIGKAKFTINGKEYTLAANDGQNHLHGGKKGFDKVVWEAHPMQTLDGPALELRYVSKDGEEGYPGNLVVTARYTLTDENGLKLEYAAATDKETMVNLTQHSYFNLAGQGDILGHEVKLNSKFTTPVDKELITTGELRPVKGTPFDFTTSTPIGARINQKDDEQIKFGGGYDHNWVIDKIPGELAVMATVTEPTTGRVMEVLSTAPGLQFYTGNFLNGTIRGKGGRVYEYRNGFCMEPQTFPDAPNKPSFPTALLKPGETYRHTIVYRFSVVH